MDTPTSCLWLQVVVDAIDPAVIVSHSSSKTFDFGSVTEPELINFSIPLELQIGQLQAQCLTACQPVKRNTVVNACIVSVKS